METEQKTEIAQETPQAPVPTEVAAPDASAVQPEVKKEVVSTEPRHPLQDILDKAAEKAAKAANKEAPKQENKDGLADKAPEAFDLAKWDGNTQTLPEKIKKIVSDNQAAFHAKAKEAAELKMQFETLQKQVNSYLAEQQKLKESKPLFTQEEFQQAQLDPSKFLELTQRVAKDIVEREKQQLEPIISQVQFNQQVAENERLINDFASKHSDFWELYDAKILEPLVAKHGLEEGYRFAKEAKDALMQKAIQDSQARVQQKKASISATPTQAQSIEVTYVDRPEDVLPTAARYAAEGKKVKVKVKN